SRPVERGAVRRTDRGDAGVAAPGHLSELRIDLETDVDLADARRVRREHRRLIGADGRGEQHASGPRTTPSGGSRPGPIERQRVHSRLPLLGVTDMRIREFVVTAVAAGAIGWVGHSAWSDDPPSD